jgi:hypothetical protein
MPSGLNSKDLASLNDLDCLNRSRDKRDEILEGIARSAEHNDSDSSFGNILLELKVTISRHEDGETGGFGCVKQLSVLQPDPQLLLDGSNVVPCQKRRELPRQLLIEQNAHERLPLHGLLPKQLPLAPSIPLERRPETRPDCDCVRDNRSDS